MHEKRWESEFQGDEGHLKADCNVKDRLGRKHRQTECGKNCFSWLMELAVQQWGPRVLFENNGGSHNTVPCCGMLCGWRAPGLLCLRPHHGHAVLHELFAAQTFLVLLKCPDHDPPGGEFSGAGPSRALLGCRSVAGTL